MTGHLVLRRRVCSTSRFPGIAQWTGSRRVSTLRKSDESKSSQKKKTKQSESRRHALPDTPCRTRFAPSPTGYLHLGSLRTALYNYLLARATKGQFVLRLEDTDRSRLVADAEQRLYEDLKWAGLAWDEGPDIGGPYGPYRQSERLSLYDEQVGRLIQSGKAYRCFCSPEELQAHRAEGHDVNSPPPPNPCVHMSPEESSDRAHRGDSYAVMFKADPTPTPPIRDIVYGMFQSSLREDDFVIRKRDGFPTYHFANVVDDHFMRITHVIRGAEWLISTPKHIQLYNALEWAPPAFAHVGLLVDKQRKKLSKRAPGVDLSWYKKEDILPSSLLNFAVLLGWNPAFTANEARSEVLTLEDMVRKFTLRFTKGDIVVEVPGKLPFLHFSHKERLLHEDPPNMPLLQTFFLKPLEKGIDRFLSKHDPSYGLVSQTASEPRARMHPRAAAAYSGETGQIVKADFFLDLLRRRLRSAADMEQFVFNSRHMIWEVPEPCLFSQFNKIQAQPRFDALLKQASRAASLCEPNKSDRSAGYALIHRILYYLRAKLEAVGPELWTTANIRPAIQVEPMSDLLGTELPTDDSTEPMPEQSFLSLVATAQEILRSALLGPDNGPPNAELLEFFGREESLGRIKGAEQMAQKVVEDPNWQPDMEVFQWKLSGASLSPALEEPGSQAVQRVSQELMGGGATR